MKICNNCSALNQDQAVRCTQCNMPGNFTEQSLTVAARKQERTKVVCLNCGSDEPGDGNKCAHCRFPLPVPSTSTGNLEYRKAIGEG